jgi:hypothetical protein
MIPACEPESRPCPNGQSIYETRLTSAAAMLTLSDAHTQKELRKLAVRYLATAAEIETEELEHEHTERS